jgi:hypothetical protein
MQLVGPVQLGIRFTHSLHADPWPAVGDFNFGAHTFLVQRSVVGGRLDEVKTEYSKDYVPLDPRLEELLLRWRSMTNFSADEDWVFANPRTGKPYHQESLRKRQLLKAAKLIG